MKEGFRVLFLGAGKRLSLLERFVGAADREGLDLELTSVEMDVRVPVAAVSRVVEGPRFLSPEFWARSSEQGNPDGLVWGPRPEETYTITKYVAKAS